MARCRLWPSVSGSWGSSVSLSLPRSVAPGRQGWIFAYFCPLLSSLIASCSSGQSCQRLTWPDYQRLAGPVFCFSGWRNADNCCPLWSHAARSTSPPGRLPSPWTLSSRPSFSLELTALWRPPWTPCLLGPLYKIFTIKLFRLQRIIAELIYISIQLALGVLKVKFESFTTN